MKTKPTIKSRSSIKSFLEQPRPEAGELLLQFVTDETAALGRLQCTLLNLYVEFLKFAKAHPTDERVALKAKQFDRMFDSVDFLNRATLGGAAMRNEIAQLRWSLGRAVEFVETLEATIAERDKEIKTLKERIEDIKHWKDELK